MKDGKEQEIIGISPATSLIKEAEVQFDEPQKCLQPFAEHPYMEQSVAAAQRMAACLRDGNKVFSCRNGGSVCAAIHFFEKLEARFPENRPDLATIALTDPAHMRCVESDDGLLPLFSSDIETLGRENDLLLAFSTRSSALDLLSALKMAKSKKMSTIVLGSEVRGAARELTDVNICVPGADCPNRAQELHVEMIHTIVNLIERQLFS